MALVVKKIILFNSNWGRREGTEKEKLIYSSSTPSLSDLQSSDPTMSPVHGDRSSVTSDTFESSNESILEEERDDLKQISLCEASINFVQSFSDNEDDLPVSIEGYSGTMLVFRRVEKPGFWFVAVLIPDAGDPIAVKSSASQPHSNEYYVTYQLLGTLYSQFVRQNGTLKHVSMSGSSCNVSSKVRMRKVCQLFFEWNQPHSLPGTGLSLPIPSPLNLFGGKSESLMKYMSLDARSFISIQSFVNHVTFSITIQPQMDTLFLYNDLIVTSSLELASTRVLYSYVTSSVLPDIPFEELNRIKKRPSSNCYWLHDGKPQIIYLPSPSSSCDFKTSLLQKSPSPLASISDEWTKKDLYIYRSVNGSTLLVLLKALDPANIDERTELYRKSLLDNIDLYAKQHLYQLTSSLSKLSIHSKSSSSLRLQQLTAINTEFSDAINVDPSISYLYYNEANASLQTSLGQSLPTSSSLKKQSSSSSFNSPMHRSSASSSSLQLQSAHSSDPFTNWTTFESDLRTTILTAAEDEVRKGIKKSDAETPDQFQISESISQKLEGSIEIIAKTDSDDHWIIFKRTDKRCLFATLMNHKNMNLQQVATLCNSKWGNIVPSDRSRRSEGTTSPSVGGSSNNVSCLPFAHLFQ